MKTGLGGSEPDKYRLGYINSGHCDRRFLSSAPSKVNLGNLISVHISDR